MKCNRKIYHLILESMKRRFISTVDVLKIFEAAIQSAQKGAVIFSLGSITNTTAMPTSLKKDILDAFARFPNYKFIMKISVADDDKQLFAAYDNVHTFAWIDQINLLSKDVLSLKSQNIL